MTLAPIRSLADSVAYRLRSPLLTLALSFLMGTGNAQADVLRHCEASADRTAAQQDRLLRMSALVRERLEATGSGVAIVARSGLNLSWWGQRYSHAGLSLQSNPAGPWFVRQLYYDCAAKEPRIFDEGLAGFVSGMADPDRGHLLLLVLPVAEPQKAQSVGPTSDLQPTSHPNPGASVVNAAAVTERLKRLALHRPTALGLLGSRYTANAHAFSTLFQNCNQWLAELLAFALQPQGLSPEQAPSLRANAQALLRAQGYEPTRFTLGNPLITWFAGRIPWLSLDDHPPEDLAQNRLRVSMPESIATHVMAHVPGVRRIEVCMTAVHIVLRDNGPTLDDDCTALAGDQVVLLD